MGIDRELKESFGIKELLSYFNSELFISHCIYTV